MGGLVALVLTAAAAVAQPRVFIDAGVELAGGIRAGVARERPEVVFVPRAEDAHVSIVVTATSEGFMLAASLRGHIVESRALGANADAAIRLAVLITVAQLAELVVEPTETSTAPPATATAPEIIATEPAVAAQTSSPEAPARVHLEGGVTAIGWATPFTVRPALSIAVLFRAEAFAVGLRGIGAGVCCSIHGDNIDVNPTLVAALADARATIIDSPLVWATASVGVAHEVVNARVVDLFAGTAGEESTSELGLLARAGLGAEVLRLGPIAASVAGGVLVHSTVLSARLPSPYRDGKTAIDRGILVPFVEVAIDAPLL